MKGLNEEVTDYIAIPRETAETARECRDFRRLALATDRRIQAAEQAAADRRAAQKARVKKLARIQKKQAQGLRRCLGYAVVGTLDFVAARLGLMDPGLAIGILGGLLVALGLNFKDYARLEKEARKC